MTRQVAIVTGAAQGLGNVIARHLHAAGYAVALADVAIEAATAHVIAAAGGPEAARVFPLALRVRADLTRHRAIPPTASPTAASSSSGRMDGD